MINTADGVLFLSWKRCEASCATLPPRNADTKDRSQSGHLLSNLHV